MNKVPFFLFLILSFLFHINVSAQANGKAPKWLSGKGFWNIESNIKTPRTNTIYFYNNNKELVYKETVTNKRVNINRKKVCKKLEAVLIQAVTAWEKQNVLGENEALVARRL
jgi:hypothetical protein